MKITISEDRAYLIATALLVGAVVWVIVSFLAVIDERVLLAVI